MLAGMKYLIPVVVEAPDESQAWASKTYALFDQPVPLGEVKDVDTLKLLSVQVEADGKKVRAKPDRR